MLNRFFAMLLAAMPLVVLAQADVQIRVLDLETGRPQAGVSVELTHTATASTRTRETRADGSVIFSVNQTGRYKISVQNIPECELVEPVYLTIHANEAASAVVLVYNPKSIPLEEAVVRGKENRVTAINRRNAEVASELSAAEIMALPIEGRDITRALYRLPNITQATGFFPEAPNVAINGANSLFTQYLIDGMDNNENFLGGQRFAIPVGFTENITVLTNNFSAEFGNTANGIINITSKSGGNQTHGEAFYMTRPGAIIDAPSRFAQRDLSGNQVRDGFMRQQAGFGIGGALKQNKTFYYLNAEYTLDVKDNLLNSPALGVNTTVRGQNDFLYLSGRLDHHWNQRHHTMLRVNHGTASIERQGGGLDGGVTFNSAGNRQLRNSANVALRHTVTGDRSVAETNLLYGRFLWDYANPNNPNDPNVTVLGPDELPVAVLGHPGFSFRENENTFQLHQKQTWYRERHTVKAGVQVKHSRFSLFGGGNPNGSYTVRLTNDQLIALAATNPGPDLGVSAIPSDAEVLFYGVELRPQAFQHSQTIYSAYLEDEFRASERLTLNLGVRYDVDDLSRGGGNDLDLNNIAPRLSANYALSPRSSLRLGYGMFYEKILYAIHSDAIQFSSDSEDYRAQLAELVNLGILPSSTQINQIVNNGNIGGTATGVNYLNGPTAESLQSQRETVFQNELRILNPNGYQNPYSHQFSLGYQYQASENTLFYVDVVHNRSHNLFRLRDLNAPEAYTIDPDDVVVRTQAEADLSRPIPIFDGSFAVINGDTLTGISRNIMMTETDGQSRYWAASFTFNKERGNDDYSVRVVYTLSRLENNTEDINFRAMDANNFDNEWGVSINDRTHVINSFVTWYPLKNLYATVATLMQSGQPINRIPDATLYGTTDLNGDGRAFGDAYVGNSDRSPGEARNSDRLPWSVTFDLNLGYTVPLGDDRRMAIYASVFNLMNAENLSGYSNNATQSNQIQAGPADSGLLIRRNAAPPRQFQFGLSYFF
jgi:outer membrane receptor protein involved in Fe transport